MRIVFHIGAERVERVMSAPPCCGDEVRYKGRTYGVDLVATDITSAVPSGLVLLSPVTPPNDNRPAADERPPEDDGEGPMDEAEWDRLRSQRPGKESS